MPRNSRRQALSRREFIKLAGGSIAAAAFLSNYPPLPVSSITSSDPGLDAKIGQMLMVGFRGLSVDDNHPIVRDIRERSLGGVILFETDVLKPEAGRNIQSPDQVKALVTALHKAATTPLLVSMDQEGGIISRLKQKYGFPPTVSHAFLGQANDLALTHDRSGQMAATLAGLGINLNLAPVVDVNTNPDNPIIAKYERSFSADPKIVTQQAIEFIQAHHEQHVLCTLKHFPGHGSSTGDTHEGVVDVTKTWSRIELEPYAALIQAGLADAIMTAHVFNATIDPQYPATLSPTTVTGFLRKELKYDGVVISDDMQMGAITKQYGFETAVSLAIQAGLDIIAIGNNLVYVEDIVSQTIAIVKKLVQAGTISEERIDQSYQRIQRLKRRLSDAKLAAAD
jgi:beta-N-acetylhexosaminidase